MAVCFNNYIMNTLYGVVSELDFKFKDIFAQTVHMKKCLHCQINNISALYICIQLWIFELYEF